MKLILIFMLRGDETISEILLILLNAAKSTRSFHI